VTRVPRDIVVTWPKTKPLQAYLDALAGAEECGEVINYRVARLPTWDDAIEDHGFRGWAFGIVQPRCYVVHTGYVRGWTEVIGTCCRETGNVLGWPSGFYIVRHPTWNPEPLILPMTSFRGWRWYEPSTPVAP
jgi:hypothetical protein